MWGRAGTLAVAFLSLHVTIFAEPDDRLSPHLAFPPLHTLHYQHSSVACHHRRYNNR